MIHLHLPRHRGPHNPCWSPPSIFPISLLAISFVLSISGCDQPAEQEDQASLESTMADASMPTAHLLDVSQASTGELEAAEADSAEVEALALADEVGSFERPLRSPMIAEDSSSDIGATLFGDYAGIYPCHDCDAQKVTLNLNIDGSVLKTTSKIKANRPIAVQRQTGQYQQQGSLIIVELDNHAPEYYFIDDSRLLLLKGDKKPAADEQALRAMTNIDYTLSRL